jgi:hypothetical protein
MRTASVLKNSLAMFWLASMKLQTNFGNSFRKLLQDYCGVFGPVKVCGKPPKNLKIIPKAACDKSIWRIFTAANEGSTLKTSTNTENGILRRIH